MNVASLENCKKLYELSGWVQPNYEPGYYKETSSSPWYELSYLLRALPKNIQIDESTGWLTLAENEDNWQCGYLMGGGYMEKQFNCLADTPEDATALLCIKLFEAGILNPTNGKDSTHD